MITIEGQYNHLLQSHLHNSHHNPKFTKCIQLLGVLFCFAAREERRIPVVFTVPVFKAPIGMVQGNRGLSTDGCPPPTSWNPEMLAVQGCSVSHCDTVPRICTNLCQDCQGTLRICPRQVERLELGTLQKEDVVSSRNRPNDPLVVQGLASFWLLWSCCM